jgi:hypothetical protein
MRRRGYVLMAALTLVAGRAAALPTPAPVSLHASAAPTAVHATAAAEVAPSPPGSETLAQQVDELRSEVGAVRSGLDASVAQAPPWAVEMREQLDRRIERMAEMQERLAARIETPTPRLDEPIVLFTVAGCTLVLGFVVGRGVQRRSNRRDLRLRL